VSREASADRLFDRAEQDFTMTSIRVAETPLVLYVLRRADDALVLGHRLSEWCGRAPMMEEEMALANMGLDLIGQARALYTYAGEVEANGHDEDALAYRRDERAYRNLLLVEQDNGDFAKTMMRQFLYAAFADPYWRAMTASRDAMLAAIAAKAEKELAYHLRHSAEWIIRMGDGTAESHGRTERAVETLWPFTGELFETDDTDRDVIAEGIGVDPANLKGTWTATITDIFARATLSVPADGYMQKGGRSGRHSEHLGHLLTELQYLQRTVPGATW
jgi:ring-1,2-phenylacetyl-CoA epoxidase subunit PaaC